MVVFGAIALVGLVVAPEVARYVVATAGSVTVCGILSISGRNKVVSRSFAEWCGVADMLRSDGPFMSWIRRHDEHNRRGR